MVMNNLHPLLANTIASVCKHFPKQVHNFRYFLKCGHFVNWNHPRNMQEYSISHYFRTKDRWDTYALLADKIRVRDFVKDRIGEQYLTKLYGTYHSAEEIDFDVLPEQFVLKTNNGCGTNVIVRDKNLLDRKMSIRQLNRWLCYHYGELTGQPHYAYIKPMILAEEYLQQSAAENILPYDYKFFCYKGKPLFVLYYEGRQPNSHKVYNLLFNMDWQPMKGFKVINPINHSVERPVCFEELKQCVTQLCAGFEFARVDFYIIGNRPLFGEMTFTPSISYNFYEDPVHAGL